MPSPLRVVVVGAGPKALFALEQLRAHVDDTRAADRIAVTVVDPGPEPGTGRAYATDQPSLLRLNVDARILDAPAGDRLPSFPEWVARTHPALADEPFPPRAVVGRYLRERWDRLSAGPPAGWIRVRRARVTALRREHQGWMVTAVGPDAAGEHLGPFDEVLVATGHAERHRGALAERWRAPQPLVPSALPVAPLLGPDVVPPASRVVVRGGALTFLDVALALTEGRGGRFTETGGAALAHHRGAAEPAVILPTTRHGLLLDAKPDPRRPLAAPVLAVLDRARARLWSLGADAPVDRVLDGVAATAAEVLRVVRPDTTDARSQVDDTLRTGAEPDLLPGPGRAATALTRSVEVARGSRSPGPAWALGRTWSALYPQVTAALRDSSADRQAWGRFRAAAGVLERFAFGPPLVTARKLLGMVGSGTVDLSAVDRSVRIDGDGVHGLPDGSPPPDLVIDAVLSPPGVVDVRDDLIEQLRTDGLVSLRPGRRGVRVDEAGTSCDAHGAPVTGLALLGRPTEDHVIGHDTLNRHLHGEISRWALRVAAGATAPDQISVPHLPAMYADEQESR
ncbi:FAD/NAD(P)-binding protein [Promicromonospora sukumoe]|uniref:FAD/NAD(P)-binding protein n=1 Tax=Promicromonospora sukumoe TaxID=88382 RepID=UPI003669C481